MANVAAKYLLLITLTGMFSILGVLCQTEPSASQVQSAFVAAHLVPDILDLSDIGNLEFLSVSFDSGVSANLGNSLRPEQIKNPQQVKWNADNSSYYMLLMIDPDSPEPILPVLRDEIHWLVFNILGGDLSTGDVIFKYFSPCPLSPAPRRYPLLLFKQPNGTLEYPYVIPVPILDNAGRPLSRTRGFIYKYNLTLMAGNFFRAAYDNFVPAIFFRNILED